MATRLVELGVPVDIKDSSGLTAREIIGNGIEQIEAGNLDAENFDMEELVLLSELLASPSKVSSIQPLG